jgi:hypothetical protein
MKLFKLYDLPEPCGRSPPAVQYLKSLCIVSTGYWRLNARGLLEVKYILDSMGVISIASSDDKYIPTKAIVQVPKLKMQPQLNEQTLQPPQPRTTYPAPGLYS